GASAQPLKSNVAVSIKKLSPTHVGIRSIWPSVTVYSEAFEA
ncbi:MAG: hypothetical protein ACI9HK_005682, partial [Pirellulaceae bacterium]